jgi:hypothetical protein
MTAREHSVSLSRARGCSGTQMCTLYLSAFSSHQDLLDLEREQKKVQEQRAARQLELQVSVCVVPQPSTNTSTCAVLRSAAAAANAKVVMRAAQNLQDTATRADIVVQEYEEKMEAAAAFIHALQAGASPAGLLLQAHRNKKE